MFIYWNVHDQNAIYYDVDDCSVNLPKSRWIYRGSLQINVGHIANRLCTIEWFVVDETVCGHVQRIYNYFRVRQSTYCLTGFMTKLTYPGKVDHQAVHRL